MPGGEGAGFPGFVPVQPRFAPARLRGPDAVSSVGFVPPGNLLMVADSERDADMLYAVRAFVPDPFIWIRRRGRSLVLVSDPELNRVRLESPHCRVLSYSRYERRWIREAKGEAPALLDVLRMVLKEQRIKRVTVAERFPLGLARGLRKGGVKVRLQEGPIFPEREVKAADEVKKISAALVMAEVGLAEGIHALRRSKIGKGRRLVLHQAPLTSERLRAIIDTAVLQAGGSPNRTIVAGGRQSFEPHERGHGPLFADQPIVIDIFPRSQRTGYHGDVTRTVVRGRASEFVLGMYAAVREAQEAAFRGLRHGVAASQVHGTVEAVFLARGYLTVRRPGHLCGFLHGTGHGVGLEIHESPRLTSRSTETLRTGNVVTLEPGLYYPEAGGVRLEDVVMVGRGPATNLTKFEKQLEI